MEDMRTVVTNSTVDGVLSALFALLVVVVLVDSARTCVRAVRRPETAVLTEAPYTLSKIAAPAGLVATEEEKAEMAAVAAGRDGNDPDQDRSRDRDEAGGPAGDELTPS
jgi:carbon starvation protein